MRPSGICVSLEPLQIGTRVRRMLKSKLPVFLQALVNDPFQLRGHIGIQSHGGDRGPVENLLEDDSRAFSSERRRSRRHLVENRAERKQIAARIQFPGSHLFRGHVNHCPYGDARAGQVVFHGRRRLRRQLRIACRLTHRLQHLRQAEIQNLRMSALGDEDIRRLDVAVDDPRRVSCVKRVCDLNSQSQQLIGRKRPAIDPLAKRLPLEILHGDERSPFMLPNFIYCADARMIQCRRHSRFTSEAFQCQRLASRIVGQKFQGRQTSES